MHFIGGGSTVLSRGRPWLKVDLLDIHSEFVLVCGWSRLWTMLRNLVSGRGIGMRPTIVSLISYRHRNLIPVFLMLLAT